MFNCLFIKERGCVKVNDLVYFTILLIVIALIFFIFYYPFLKTPRIKRFSENDIERFIAILVDSNANDEKKAKAICKLAEAGYIDVHKIINKGGNYDDKKQTQLFCRSMDNKQIIESLGAIGEEDDGKYTFRI